MPLCRCGSGLDRYDLCDAAGIFCTYVCEKCESVARERFNSTIFRTDHPYARSGKEEDLEIDYGEDEDGC